MGTGRRFEEGDSIQLKQGQTAPNLQGAFGCKRDAREESKCGSPEAEARGMLRQNRLGYRTSSVKKAVRQARDRGEMEEP